MLPFGVTLEYKPYRSVFFSPFFFFLIIIPHPPLVCLPKKCDNASPKQQGTNKIPLCGHDWPVCCCTCRRGFRAFECLRVLSLSERISGVNSNILTRALNKMKQGDANRRRGRKQAHCWYMHVPLPDSPSCSYFVYSLFQCPKVDLLMLNYVTFSGSD